MSTLPASRLLSCPFADPEIAGIFSDEGFVRCMLEVEAALAKAQAKLGVIPPDSGDRIASQSASLQVNYDRLRAGLAKDGIPVIELVRQLREHVGGAAASYVHFGATSQDVMDTALVLQIRDALGLMDSTMHRLMLNLAGLADRYRNAVMPGRTHSQQAVPIPFGLKVAGWLAPLLRHSQRLAEMKPRLLVIQLGGAAGTLAPLGSHGTQVQEALAAELGLGVPLMPWHTQRDTLVELAGWLSLVSGSLGKMAQDIILLSQTEVGEVRESTDSARGGSSTMPQKSNPVLSEQVIACARTNAALLSSMHHALIQEHERGTHGWQMEWLALPEMFVLAAAALRKAESLSEMLDVDEAHMRHNVIASHGLMLAEAISYALSASMGRDEARTLVREASRVAASANRHLIDVVRERTSAPVDWEGLKDASAHFGSAQVFIDQVLRAAAGITSGHRA